MISNEFCHSNSHKFVAVIRYQNRLFYQMTATSDDCYICAKKGYTSGQDRLQEQMMKYSEVFKVVEP